MQIHVDDDGFVRAPAFLVYRRLTNIGAWSSWWPGLSATRLADVDGREAWGLTLQDGLVGGLRIALVPHTYRHDAGFRLDVTGDIAGTAEFWLEPVAGGTVVHHVLIAEARRRPLRTLRTYRRVLRRGFWGMKDRIQTEVRTAVGLTP